MDKTNLRQGTAYRKAESAYDRVMHISGVPRPYWNVQRNSIAFAAFKQVRKWREGGEDKQAKSNYAASEQQAVFDGMVDTINERVEGRQWFDYADCGGAIVMSSSPTDQKAKKMAGFLVGEVQRCHEGSTTRWHDVNQRTRWGRMATPDPDLFPDLVVLTGLHPNPTPDGWESVRCWSEWAIRRCPCVLVGSGTDPMDLARRWYGIEPIAVLFAYNEIGDSRTYG